MSDNLIAFDFGNVVHWRYERHFTCFLTLVCRSSTLWTTFQLLSHFGLSFISLMNDISIAFSLWFVVHWRYERHFTCFLTLECRSLALWTTFQLLSLWFVVHHRYERHSTCFLTLDCRSSTLWTTFQLLSHSGLSFISLMNVNVKLTMYNFDHLRMYKINHHLLLLSDL